MPRHREAEPAVPSPSSPTRWNANSSRDDERPLERASFSTWGTPPAAPDRRSLVVPLSFAMLLGLAGGFGLGYWFGWRSALRESSATAASAPGEAAGRAPSASVASRPAASEASAPPPREARPRRAQRAARAAAGRAPRRAQRAPPRAQRPPARASAPRRARRAKRGPSGKLLVQSTPSGAQVRWTAASAGRTPLILRDMPLNVVRVTVDAAGLHAERAARRAERRQADGDRRGEADVADAARRPGATTGQPRRGVAARRRARLHRQAEHRHDAGLAARVVAGQPPRAAGAGGVHVRG